MVLLLLSLLLGYLIVRFCFKIDNFVIQFAGSFLIGSLFSGTFLYIIDLIMINVFGNRWISNVVYAVVVIGVSVWMIYSNRFVFINRSRLNALFKDSSALTVILTSTAYSFWMNYHTFHTDKGSLVLRGGAWSDIMYHNAFIRSISLGANVPTTYPYFADTDIHYHFMFNYFGGKLAQFGMSSVNALNITSSLGFAAMLILLFELGRVYFKSNTVGVLTALFMVLHSSASAFKWVYENSIADTLKKSGWLKGVNFEGWGLFNFNVFINQRHFAYGLAFCVFVVLFMVVKRNQSVDTEKTLKFRGIFKWGPICPFVLLGISVGIFPYWNVIIAPICIGFIGALGLSEIRLNRTYAYRLLFAALIAGLLVGPQLLMFKSGDTVLTGYPKFQPGYEIQGLSVLTFLKYYYDVLGFKFILMLSVVFLVERNKKIDFMIFMVPFAIANILQMGKVLYDNNKLMIISLMFANMFAAYLIVRIAQWRGSVSKSIAVVLTMSIILAGVIDTFALKNMDKILIKDSDSGLRNWIVENTEKDAVFLTGNSIPYGDNALTAVTLSGRMLYCVRNNVDPAIDVSNRMMNINRIFSFQDGLEDTIALVKRENIDYILIDSTLRSFKELSLDETVFGNNFTLEYFGEKEYGGQNVYVYSVRP
ncbi:MAG: hypothetical protein PHU83_07390 [Eubacteriales bacterium]|nr:hypothetical protein [Eubacteriales bacterium]